MNRQLSQQEIDAVFQNLQDRKREAPAARFDFRRPDRIPKSQVRAIHLLHDTFVRNVVSSLSASTSILHLIDEQAALQEKIEAGNLWDLNRSIEIALVQSGAIHREIASEINAPPKPQIIEMIARPPSRLFGRGFT